MKVGKVPMRLQHYLTYYQKYYCKNCSEFTLRIHNDMVCECENECDINIGHIDYNKYDGLYDREEIEASFYVTEIELLRNFLSMIQGYFVNFHTLSKKEAQSINNLFEDKLYTEIKIDDVVIKYLKENNLKHLPNKMDNFGYIINLIEDIHYFLIRSTQDIAHCMILH